MSSLRIYAGAELRGDGETRCVVGGRVELLGRQLTLHVVVDRAASTGAAVPHLGRAGTSGR